MLLVRPGADPWLTRSGYNFLLVMAEADRITLRRSRTVEGLASVVPQTIFDHPLTNVWASELHYLAGRFWLIFAAGDGGGGQRTWVSSAPAAVGPYDPPQLLNLPDGRWSIDCTYGVVGGQLYAWWSGWEGDANVMQSIYSCRMLDPATPTGPRVRIASPELPWETHGTPLVLEGPELVRHDATSTTLLTYSGSGSWTDDYAVGAMILTGSNPLDPTSWRKLAAPILASGPGRPAPGHASFVREQLSDEWTVCFHQQQAPGSGWNREVHAERFTWALMPAIAA